ncbi:hypothetical protein Tsp_05832 [Trichinella spiralis]|uniref:hypothetical protein n=1 Tax=Trichinella spiralis TaxID=6334 RepID=UPI0001EFC1E5|nr:hypothetical protein Tsp_05832 [Trichinella spiralis]
MFNRAQALWQVRLRHKPALVGSQMLSSSRFVQSPTGGPRSKSWAWDIKMNKAKIEEPVKLTTGLLSAAGTGNNIGRGYELVAAALQHTAAVVSVSSCVYAHKWSEKEKIFRKKVEGVLNSGRGVG